MAVLQKNWACFLTVVIVHLTVLAGGNPGSSFNDHVLYHISWPGAATDPLDVDVDSLLMTTSNNEKFRCILPKQISSNQEDALPYNGPNGLQLLSPVFNQNACSYRLETYWTYEVCHGRWIRQYHQESGKNSKVTEFNLGKIEASKLEARMRELSEDPLRPVPTKKIEGQDMPYVELNMTGGTLCDLNQVERRTRVLYVCYQNSKHDIYNLEEVRTCEYEVIILSPLLCEHPRYRVKRETSHEIRCHSLEDSAKKPQAMLLNEAEGLKSRAEALVQEIYPGNRVKIEVTPVDEVSELDDIPPPTTADTSAVPPQPLPPPPPQNIFDSKLVEDFLNGEHCLHGGTGWWKYEFCYGKRVDQYHIEADGSRTIVHLGVFNKDSHLQWLKDNPQKRPKPGPSRRHVIHFYSKGSICDITGKPRQVEVKLKCKEGNNSPSAVTLYLLEPKTCEYLLGVESPIICPLLSTADSNGFMALPVTPEGQTPPPSTEDQP